MTTMQAYDCLCDTRRGPCLVQRVADHNYICLHTLKQHDLAKNIISDKSQIVTLNENDNPTPSDS